jgi:hypothetical protein
MRRLALVGLAMLAGCGDQPARRPVEESRAAREQAPEDDGMAACAVGGSATWARDCRVEVAGEMLIVRHPDGGFRRFRLLRDGRGLEAADGAEPARLTISGDRQIELVAGADRYRLPARIAGR